MNKPLVQWVYNPSIDMYQCFRNGKLVEEQTAYLNMMRKVVKDDTNRHDKGYSGAA